MNCVICETGAIVEGRTTVTRQRGATAVVIKDVPTRVCDNCGKYYLSKAMTEPVLGMVDNDVSKGTEIEVLRWAT